jgi:hypothetical protein
MRKAFSPIGLIDVVIIFVTIGALYLGAEGFLNDPGAGWHLATGDIIASSGFVPSIDPFLARVNTPWVCDQWLGDLVSWIVYSWFGATTLLVLFVAVFIATFFGVLYPACKRAVPEGIASRVALAAVLLVVCKVATIQFYFRPVLFGFFFFTTTYALTLSLYDKLRRGNCAPAYVWLVAPLLFFLWSNMHPSFPLGLILFGVLLVSLLLEKFLQGAPISDQQYLTVIALGILCGAVTVMNPAGMALHESILALGSSEYFMKLHQEWRAISFADDVGQQLLALLIPVVLFLYAGAGRLLPLFPAIAAAAFTLLGLQSVRMAPHAAITLALPATIAITYIMSRAVVSLPVLHRLQSLDWAFFEQTERRAWLGKNLAPLLLIVVALVPGGYELAKIPPVRFSAAHYPVDVIDRIKAQAADYAAGKMVIFNHPDYGGYLALHNQGSYQVLNDDRNLTMGEERTRMMYQAFTEPHRLMPLARAERATHILIPKDSATYRGLRALGVVKSPLEGETAVFFPVI